MVRGLWVTLVVLCVGGSLVWADGDCGCESTVQPTCYETFRSNEIIEFKVTVPADYFWLHEDAETPLIVRWWVETLDGVIVRDEPLPYPVGSWASFTWDLTTGGCELVGPGFYRIVILTTSGMAVSTDVLIEPCRPCSSWWSCWPCCPTLVCVCQRSTRCPIPCGEPYLILRNGGTRSCCGLSVRIFGGIGVGVP